MATTDDGRMGGGIRAGELERFFASPILYASDMH
jgi:hypothetical protein